MGKLVHPLEPRQLSIREYARIQGFPDMYQFSVDGVTEKDAYRVIGNAVPPSVTYALGILFIEIIRDWNKREVVQVPEESPEIFQLDDYW